MTDLAALEPIARNLLDKHGGDADRALPSLRKLLMKRADLLDALALAYLETVAQSLPGQTPSDAHERAAGTAAAGHWSFDTHTAGAGGGPVKRPQPIKVHEHHRARASTREIAIIAMAKNLTGVLDRPILGRAIGDFFWRELPDLRRTLTMNTVSHLSLGLRAAQDAVLIDKILCHVARAEGHERVRDLLSEDTFVELELEADRDTVPKLDVSKGAAHVAFVGQFEYRPAS